MRGRYTFSLTKKLEGLYHPKKFQKFIESGQLGKIKDEGGKNKDCSEDSQTRFMWYLKKYKVGLGYYTHPNSKPTYAQILALGPNEEKVDELKKIILEQAEIVAKQGQANNFKNK